MRQRMTHVQKLAEHENTYFWALLGTREMQKSRTHHTLHVMWKMVPYKYIGSVSRVPNAWHCVWHHVQLYGAMLTMRVNCFRIAQDLAVIRFCTSSETHLFRVLQRCSVVRLPAIVGVHRVSKCDPTLLHAERPSSIQGLFVKTGKSLDQTMRKKQLIFHQHLLQVAMFDHFQPACGAEQRQKQKYSLLRNEKRHRESTHNPPLCSVCIFYTLFGNFPDIGLGTNF